MTDTPATIAPPSDLTDAIEPVDSTDPTHPNNSIDPTHPTDSIDPTHPTDGDTADATVSDLAGESGSEPVDAIDLDAMDADFVAVERALVRLADGTYWVDEVTGEPIPDDVLIADPMTRRAVQG